jgi:hypothetical protein
MNIKVCTSYAPEHWDKHAGRMVLSFLEHWPKDVCLGIWGHGPWPPDLAKESRITWYDLEKDDAFVAFRREHAGKGKGMSDVVRFSHKVFALTHAIPDCDWWVWLDADTETFRDIDERFVKAVFPEEKALTFLGREMFPCSETGFVAYNVRHAKARAVLRELRRIYGSGDIFKLAIWGDAMAFDTARRTLRFPKELENNLTGDAELRPAMSRAERAHVWPRTILGKYMAHYKGRRKTEAR